MDIKGHVAQPEESMHLSRRFVSSISFPIPILIPNNETTGKDLEEITAWIKMA